MPTRIEIGKYEFRVADEYRVIEPIVEVYVPRQPFTSEEQASEAKGEVEEMVAELGRWEDTISALRHLREGVEEQPYSEETRAIHAEDIEADTIEGRDGFKLILDIADKSEANLYKNPHLRDAAVWRRSLENLPHWRSLQRVLSLFRRVGQSQ